MVMGVDVGGSENDVTPPPAVEVIAVGLAGVVGVVAPPPTTVVSPPPPLLEVVSPPPPPVGGGVGVIGVVGGGDGVVMDIGMVVGEPKKGGEVVPEFVVESVKGVVRVEREGELERGGKLVVMIGGDDGGGGGGADMKWY